MAWISIRRESQFAASMRNFKILLDGNKVETISDGEVKTLKVPPGRHKLLLKMDWFKSEEVEFQSNNNETIHFQCGSGVKMKNFIWMWVALMLLIGIILFGGFKLVPIEVFLDYYIYGIIGFFIVFILVFVIIFSIQKWVYLKRIER
tara:strand:+ start:528 stop:968 length:441 start_codon:yes stop_codon:yes gene_type:complete